MIIYGVFHQSAKLIRRENRKLQSKDKREYIGHEKGIYSNKSG